MSTTESPPAVGLVGLGHMGSIISRHIRASGRPVIGWDRRPEAVESLAAAGGIPAATLSDLHPAPVVISIVFDDEGTREITLGAGGLLDTLPPGGIHVVMASITPALTRILAEAHEARGQGFLAASVFGRPEAAEAAELLINCSGQTKVYDAVQPILSVLGTPRLIGTDAEQAMLVKTMGNSLIHTTVEMLREMFQFLAAAGIDGPLAKELLVDSLFSGPIASGYAQRYIDDPGSARMIDMARKDRRNCLEAAERMGVSLPVISFLGDHDLP